MLFKILGILPIEKNTKMLLAMGGKVEIKCLIELNR